MRELFWLAEGAWSRTASILAMIVNVNRDAKKSSPARPDDWNPYTRRRRAGVTRVPGKEFIGALAKSVGGMKTQTVKGTPRGGETNGH